MRSPVERLIYFLLQRRALAVDFSNNTCMSRVVGAVGVIGIRPRTVVKRSDGLVVGGVACTGRTW